MKIIKEPRPAKDADRSLTRTMLRAVGDCLEERACYANSLKAMVAFEHPDRLTYVEGWLISIPGEYPIEHGWLEYDGSIVDLTLPDEKPEHYYAVFRYTVEEAIALVGRRTLLPFFHKRKRKRQAMIDAFYRLPLNHDLARFWAILGDLETGIQSVILEPEPLLRRNV